jgi:hypothetical protein
MRLESLSIRVDGMVFPTSTGQVIFKVIKATIITIFIIVARVLLSSFIDILHMLNILWRSMDIFFLRTNEANALSWLFPDDPGGRPSQGEIARSSE